ncbi:MAG: HisA/HisF-related TIM barrel protein, partial [Sphingomonadales bacterium]
KNFGSQCIVIGIDSQRTGNGYQVYQFTGSEKTIQPTGRKTLDWISEVTDRGAGEIVLNCMDQDGIREGYDIPQLQAARAKCPVPLIASGGAGDPKHFADVFQKAGVEGALAASVFHNSILEIPELKKYLYEKDIEVRLT